MCLSLAGEFSWVVKDDGWNKKSWRGCWSKDWTKTSYTCPETCTSCCPEMFRSWVRETTQNEPGYADAWIRWPTFSWGMYLIITPGPNLEQSYKRVLSFCRRGGIERVEQRVWRLWRQWRYQANGLSTQRTTILQNLSKLMNRRKHLIIQLLFWVNYLF